MPNNRHIFRIRSLTLMLLLIVPVWGTLLLALNLYPHGGHALWLAG